jgi:hypothetical protein
LLKNRSLWECEKNQTSQAQNVRTCLTVEE